MAIQNLRYSDSLDTILEELVYTQAKLKADTATKADLGTALDALIDRADATHLGQRKAWRNEVITQAQVDFCDDELDDLVGKFGEDLKHAVGKNTESLQYRIYFKDTPTSVIRLGLESELQSIQKWPENLQGESNATLKGYAALFQQSIQQGTTAVNGRTDAITATGLHRAREIVRLVDDVNAARSSLHGILEDRGSKLGKPKNWADRFFRHAVRAAKQKQPEPAPAAAAGGK